MSDKHALLAQLKLDRDAPPEHRGRPLKWLLLFAVIAGAALGVSLFSFGDRDQPIAVATAMARTVQPTERGTSVLDATGYVVARRQATVSSKVTGKVVEVFIEEGDAVADGQLLARLDDSIPAAQLQLAESQVAAARAGLDELDVQIRQAQLDLDRTQGLAQRNLASQAELDRDQLSVEALVARRQRTRDEIVVAERNAAVQRQVVDDMQIRAPFAGIVVAKAAQPGEMISPVSAGGGYTRTGICTIVDMASLEVEVDVNESYINRVDVDQPVAVTLNAYPDHQFPAAVIAIIPAADRNKATVRVRIGLLERDGRVLPDMGVRVAFLESSQQSEAQDSAALGVLVPSAAVAGSGSDRFVFVVEGDRARRQSVIVAGQEGARTRLLGGLSDGDRVVAALTEELVAALGAGAVVQAQ
ncbi:MAG: efflux RND transporter periplasmic adaptor subunit [Pseudomonadales bacterium]